ncbi:ribose ABC transporter substrate-binding protein RbsB [Alkalibacillus haloalkaliphilus]|uniref:ribose ABC transporter substrate-binding protein RbsB n=1 Tax=Alkalibacillus haloalkaliphilus TaxID=94136 RepID=UPI002936AA3C|nr:ribose ABC transporter substrate-binding protein RbsB [Alkalibacillus haloalkaliphilus]MDV2582213.1 ribose ABC transporter substrate-binding protein RbsB [Alkalibacillus haloalkaliphilus]
MFTKFKLGLIAFLTVGLLAACTTESPTSNGDDETDASGDDGEVHIGLAVSTQNNPFFVTLREGAEEKAEELGVDITVVDAQDDAATQLSSMEDLIQQDVDVLVVNPTDSEAVITAVEAANEADIPVVTVDRSADGGEVVAHIASDNVAGGEMAGDFIIEQLGGEGNVVELEGIPGSSAARERGEGFHNSVGAEDGIEVVAEQPADFDRAEGLTVMENIIQSGEEFDAVFAHNDEMALGAVRALESAGMDDVIVVGFDATDDAVEAVEAGEMDATIAQQPIVIGEQGVETALDIANGETVEDFIPVDLELVTE